MLSPKNYTAPNWRITSSCGGRGILQSETILENGDVIAEYYCIFSAHRFKQTFKGLAGKDKTEVTEKLTLSKDAYKPQELEDY